MGAIVGGAYAAGRLDALEVFARQIDRKAVWRLADLNLGSGGGLVHGVRIAAALQEVIGKHDINSLAQKFTAVATDLGAGHEVWLSTGDLVEAMRASYALPGIFVPSRIDGRVLIDGGITNPVPVSACRALGAHVVIAVPLPAGPSVGPRFAPAVRPGEDSAWRKALAAFREPERFVAGQLFGDSPETLTTASVSVAALNILLDRMTRVRLASDPPDVTVTSEIGSIALLEFDRADEAIEIGAEAAKRVLPEIAALVAKGAPPVVGSAMPNQTHS
jgi:NTE family protein